jgi:hypothetical protein
MLILFAGSGKWEQVRKQQQVQMMLFHGCNAASVCDPAVISR